MISCQLILVGSRENSLRQLLTALSRNVGFYRDLEFRRAFWLGLQRMRHAIDNLGQWRLWPESGQSKQLFDRRHAPHHVFETRFIRLIVRYVFDRRCAVGA